MEHTYLLKVGRQEEDWDEPWRQLGLRLFAGSRVGSMDILSVSLNPKEASYANSDVGVAPTFSGNLQRRALYTPTPGQVEYRVRVPDGGRFDVGLGLFATMRQCIAQ